MIVDMSKATMVELLDKIASADSAKADKLRAAIRAAAERMVAV